LSSCLAGAEKITMNKTDLIRTHLQQRWIFIEDTGSEFVYSSDPSVYSNVAGRGGVEGRMEMEFRPDGTCTISGAGPNDRPQESGCKWELEENEKHVIKIDFIPKSTVKLEIASIDPSRLLIKKR
jgi:hypothetical protein